METCFMPSSCTPILSQILDYTPDRDLDSDELRTALEFAKTLCTHVNEAVRSKENTEQLEWLQMHVQFTLDEVGGVVSI